MNIKNLRKDRGFFCNFCASTLPHFCASALSRFFCVLRVNFTPQESPPQFPHCLSPLVARGCGFSMREYTAQPRSFTATYGVKFFCALRAFALLRLYSSALPRFCTSALPRLYSSALPRFCAFALILLVFSLFVSNVYAQTELGSQDDLTVLGINGTVPDPDVEIKGFTIFGSTNVLTHISTAAGNVIFNGAVESSSDVYIVGISTFEDNVYFSGAGSIFINGGLTDQILKKAADGSMYWGDDQGGISGTGIANYLPLWKTDTELTNSKINQAEVGTDTHVYVNADIHFSSAVYFGSGVNISTFTEEGELDIMSSTNTSYSLTVGTSTEYNLVVTTGGNVGIGTTEPNSSAIMDIAGNIFLSGAAKQIYFGSLNDYIYGDPNNYFHVRVGGGDRFTVKNTGRVGINNQNPDAKIEVSAAGGSDDLLMLSSDLNGDGDRLIVKNNGSIGISTRVPQATLHIVSTDTISHIFKTQTGIISGTEVVISTAGNLGIGTETPQSGLDIQSSTNTAYSLAVGTSSAYNMVISTNGDVGVGLVNPLAKVHIQAYESGKELLYVSTSATVGYYSISVSSLGITNINNLVIENRTSDPANPVTGQIWLRTD